MELAQSKREQRHYLKQVELGKSLEKRKRKRDKEEAAGTTLIGSKVKPDVKRRKVDEKKETGQVWKNHDRNGDGKGRDVVRDKRREGDLDKVLGSIF